MLLQVKSRNKTHKQLMQVGIWQHQILFYIFNNQKSQASLLTLRPMVCIQCHKKTNE